MHCGHRARAKVVGIGEGMQSFLNSRGTAVRRAEVDARRDIERTIARVRCPKCQRRDPQGVWKFFKPFAIAAAFIIATGVVLGFAPTWFNMNMSSGDKRTCQWVVPLVIIGPMLLMMPFQLGSRWRSTERHVTWLADE